MRVNTLKSLCSIGPTPPSSRLGCGTALRRRIIRPFPTLHDRAAHPRLPSTTWRIGGPQVKARTPARAQHHRARPHAPFIRTGRKTHITDEVGVGTRTKLGQRL
jgi:hypothetical protein